ncbi:nuclear transport factor 2 family protein [Pendulispora albinea]|uniref:Nuclear transport factor 2 family protein n=1 Tax=Pendulispora albinea TaxID=2741071 RepID=A0ABZ2LZM1_9BACT
MTKGSKFVAVVMAALAVAGVAYGAAPADPTAEILRIDDQWVDAIDRHDRATLDAIVAPDHIETTPRGVLYTRAQLFRFLDGPAPRSATGQTSKLSDRQVHLYGNTAIVTGINTITNTTPASIVTIRFTDVFVKLDGRWRAVAAHTSRVEPAPK